MENKKLVLYCSHGLGDFYEMLCMVPEIKRINSIKDEDVHFFIDSVYFHDKKYKVEMNSTIDLLALVGNNGICTIVPENIGSYHGLIWYGNSDWRKGIEYDKIKNDFLFYREQKTKDYMKEQIDENTIFIYSSLGGNFVYEWKNGENIKINYKMKPIKLRKKTILIHSRIKGFRMDSNFFTEIINHCIRNNFMVCLIGNKNEITIDEHPQIEDTTGKLALEYNLDLIENCDYMIGNSSMFTLHRLMFNKPTIICTPEDSWRTPGYKYLFNKKQLENPNFLFLNSDEDNIEIIKNKIDEWSKE
jgi:ADP-heptose:LPS heptosyltransferase